jgi:uncharacterized repeat protein (TIGR02543 family)
LNNEKKQKNGQVGKTTALIVLGLLVVIGAGILIGKLLLKGTEGKSLFAGTGNEKIQINYNYNLFDYTKGIKGPVKAYNKKLQILNFTDAVNGNYPLGNLSNVKLNKGDIYKITVNYVGGSYSVAKGNYPQFVFELQQDGLSIENKQVDVHYLALKMPLVGNAKVEKTITITSVTEYANGFYYWINQKSKVLYNNYRFQVFVTKVDSKMVSSEGIYGELLVPDKDGYTFEGWYDSLSGNNKILNNTTITKKYNHTLYAHWKATSSSGSGSGSGTTPTTCNVKNCAECKSENVCSKCKSGYVLNNGECVTKTCSIPNCAICLDGICTRCNAGYKLENGNCVKVSNTPCTAANCKTCADNTLNKCSVCNDGYKLNSNGTCTKCSAISYCEEKDANCNCTKCKTGYYLNSNNKCSKCTKSGCNKCDSTGKCAECKDGYTLVDGSCTRACSNIDGCEVCNNNKCTKCKTGYALVSGKCQKCMEGCQNCNLDVNRCIDCKYGYTLDSTTGKCEVTCELPNCTACDTINHCIKCATGYELNGDRCRAYLTR